MQRQSACLCHLPTGALIPKMTSVFGIICWSRHFFMPNGINHPEPLSSHNILTNVSLVEHQLSKPNHTADRFVSCGTVKHFYPHWCQRNTQAAASSTTFVCEGERAGEREGETDGRQAKERERQTVQLFYWIWIEKSWSWISDSSVLWRSSFTAHMMPASMSSAGWKGPSNTSRRHVIFPLSLFSKLILMQ